MSVGNGDFETPGIEVGEADEWTLDGNCEAVMSDPSFCAAGVNGNAQVVLSLHSKQIITLDGGDFQIKKPGTDVEHSVLTLRDANNNPLWRLHVRNDAVASGTLRNWSQSDTPMVIDALGNAYISFQTGDGGNNTGAQGTPYDVGIVGIDGKTILNEYLQSFVGYRDVSAFLMKVTPTGTVAWVSRVASHSDSTQAAESSFLTGHSLTLLDDNTLGVQVAKYPGGSHNMAGATDTITFMPDTDGTKSLVYNRNGGAFFMRVNTANGVLYETPEALQDYSYADPVYFTAWCRRHGFAITDSGKCAWSYEASTNRWNGDYTGHLYRARTQATDPVTGDAPSPGYPTNMRWETFPAGAVNAKENPQAVVLMRESMMGDPRYVVVHSPESGSTTSAHRKRALDGGVAAIPGGDDILWGYSNVYYDAALAGFSTKLVSDRLEQGSWTFNITDIPTQYYCDVVRLNDNVGTPTDPTVDWIIRFDSVANGTGGEWWKGGPKISPVDDVFTVAHTIGLNANITPIFRRIEPSVVDPFGTMDFAPKNGINYGAAVIYGAQVSDGTPRWYQVIELGQPSGAIEIPGLPARRGREFWYPFNYKGQAIFDPNGDWEFTTGATGSNHYGYVRYDITTGAFKGWHEIGSGNEAPIGPYGWREGFCDIRDDVADVDTTIGVPITPTPALVVENATGTVTITNEGDDLTGSGLTLNPDGSISGTPTTVGPYFIVLKAQDAGLDFSYSNRFRVGDAVELLDSFETGEGWS